MALEPGSDFAHYKIVGTLGTGGMARVFRATQPSLHRDVAIKVIGAHLAEQPSFRARFQREAAVLARLEHPNILTVFDYGEEDGQPYIVYRYVAGGTLRDLLGGPLPLDQVARLLAPVASALDFAHRRGVVHRDIKPSNILLTEDGVPIVADFGLARLTDAGLNGDDSERLTQVGTALGTPAYMAPEQVEGDAAVPASDQYALGVIAYEMLTGAVPFQADTPLAVALKHVREPLTPASQRNPAVAATIDRVLGIALAKQPNARFPSCSAFIDALAALPRTAASSGSGMFPAPQQFRRAAERGSSGSVSGSTPSGANAAAAGTPAPSTPAGAIPPVGGAVTPTPGSGLSRPESWMEQTVPASSLRGSMESSGQTSQARPTGAREPVPGEAAAMSRRQLLVAGVAGGAVLLAGGAGIGVWLATRKTTPNNRTGNTANAVNNGLADNAQANRASGSTNTVASGATGRAGTPVTSTPTPLQAGAALADDGPGTTARFASPQAVVTDGRGNLFVADSENNRIRRIAADRTVTTYAGTGDSGYQDGPAARALFSNPTDLAFDAAGNLYVADSDNNRIRVIKPDRTVGTIGTSDWFVGPNGLTVSPDGTVYVSDVDDSTSRIRKASPPYDTVTTLAGAGARGYLDGPGATAKFDGPSGLALDRSGNLFVSDVANNRIRKVAPDGTVSTFVGGSDSDYKDGTGILARFYHPVALAMDAQGNLYVTDLRNYRIRKVTPSGTVTTVAGSGTNGYSDGAASSAALGEIEGIGVAADGTVYLADSSNNRIRVISSSGAVSTIAGSGPTGNATATPAPTRAPTPLTDTQVQPAIERAALQESDVSSIGFRFDSDSRTDDNKIGEIAYYEESFKRTLAGNQQTLGFIFWGYHDAVSAHTGFRAAQNQLTGATSTHTTAISGPQGGLGDEFQSYQVTDSSDSGYAIVWRTGRTVVAALNFGGSGVAVPTSISTLAGYAATQDTRLRANVP